MSSRPRTPSLSSSAIAGVAEAVGLVIGLVGVRDERAVVEGLAPLRRLRRRCRRRGRRSRGRLSPSLSGEGARGVQGVGAAGGLVGVGLPVVVVVGISDVADPVAVGVDGLARVVGEGVVGVGIPSPSMSGSTQFGGEVGVEVVALRSQQGGGRSHRRSRRRRSGRRCRRRRRRCRRPRRRRRPSARSRRGGRRRRYRARRRCRRRRRRRRPRRIAVGVRLVGVDDEGAVVGAVAHAIALDVGVGHVADRRRRRGLPGPGCVTSGALSAASEDAVVVVVGVAEVALAVAVGVGLAGVRDEGAVVDPVRGRRRRRSSGSMTSPTPSPSVSSLVRVVVERGVVDGVGDPSLSSSSSHTSPIPSPSWSAWSGFAANWQLSRG